MVDNRPDAGGGFKAGDRIRYIGGVENSAPGCRQGDEFTAIDRLTVKTSRTGVHPLVSSVCFLTRAGEKSWRPGVFFELVAAKPHKTETTGDDGWTVTAFKEEYAERVRTADPTLLKDLVSDILSEKLDKTLAPIAAGLIALAVKNAYRKV